MVQDIGHMVWIVVGRLPVALVAVLFADVGQTCFGHWRSPCVDLTSTALQVARVQACVSDREGHHCALKSAQYFTSVSGAISLDWLS